MSIRGRRLMDCIKKSFGKMNITFPVPPYASSEYWERVYSGLNENDCHEWADVSFMDVIASKSNAIVFNKGVCNNDLNQGQGLPDFLNLPPPGSQTGLLGGQNITVLNIGCGNSNFGFEMHKYLTSFGFKNQMIQTDISESLISSLKTRYQSNYPDMKFELSDALDIPYRRLHAVVDKGLIDAMFCSNTEKIVPIFESVYASLRTNGVFLFFSLSHPQYMMDEIYKGSHKDKHRYNKVPVPVRKSKWDIEVRENDKIYVYKLTKLIDSDSDKSLPSMYKKNTNRRCNM